MHRTHKDGAPVTSALWLVRANMNIRVLVIGILVATSPAASAANDLRALLKDAVVTITQRRVLEPEKEKYFSCAEFARTAAEVKTFLTNAEPITTHEQHYEFDIYHCEVAGKAVTKAGEFQFTVRLGGTGSVTYPDGREVLLGCRDKCCKVVGKICG